MVATMRYANLVALVQMGEIQCVIFDKKKPTKARLVDRFGRRYVL